MEEEDDDADLKRLMNQAQAMLSISDNHSQAKNRSENDNNDSRTLIDETELDKEKIMGASVLPDPNYERR